MGWVPSGKRGVSEEGPAPRRRRTAPAPEPEPTPAKRRVKPGRRVSQADAATMSGRDKRITDHRPAGGVKGHENDERSRGVTIHLGKRWAQIVTEIKRGDYTWRDFAESLTAEELARGQLKDKNGGFSGRPPSIVPREFHLACFRELKRRFDEEFQGGVLAIAKEYVTLAQDTSIPAKDRAKMMQYAMERVFGGIPKEVMIKQEAPWEGVFSAVIVNEATDEPAYHEKHRYDEYDPDREEEGSDDTER